MNATQKLKIIQNIVGCVKNSRKKNSKKVMSEVCPVITESTNININHARELFFSKCDDKGKNDKYNKLREEILANILSDKYKSFMDDIYWKNIKDGWNTILGKAFKKPFDTLKIIPKGGRRFNYDFDVQYHKDNKLVETLKIEFKYGGKVIDEIPQFFNADANKSFLKGYAEWFYDTYVTKQSPWKDFEPPSKEIYMREIYKNSSKIVFFKKLYEAEKDKEFYNKKSLLVKESIATWLEENYKKLNLKELSNEFIRSQNDKVFILWDKDTFYIDIFEKDELTVSNIIGIKNKNTILINSQNNKIQYELLLRWKNHLGVLKPAWQISMKRILA